jgi:monoamine oxidase
MSSQAPEDRIKQLLEYGEKIHPGNYKREYECGVSVAWHRVPWTLGCSGSWTEAGREQHYDNLCALDGRIVLAGEHASRLPTWQEGAVVSATDAIIRLHAKAVQA